MYQPLSYIDLHCDTALELYERNENLDKNDLAVSLDAAAGYERYLQCYAIFSSHSLSDEDCYTRFLAASDYFSDQLSRSPDIVQINSREDLETLWRSGKYGAILAVEDARLLAGRTERLEVLAKRGVKYLTLTWAGETIIGGSHNTEAGLTPFGIATVGACFDLGIAPDISHASEKTANEVLSLAEKEGKPVLATHSDSYTIYPHRRNLRDDQFRRIRDLGGLVGINLFVDHLGDSTADTITTDTILRHIDHYLSLNGENTLAIGGDLDGAALPAGYDTVADVAVIAEALDNRGYGKDLIDDLFWRNAYRFFNRQLNI